MRGENLVDVLSSLPSRTPTPARLAADVIPLLSEWLGFPRDWVRFEYALGVRAGAVDLFDAVILHPEFERPIIVFEVKGRSLLARDDYSESQLRLVAETTHALAAILLTHNGLLFVSGEARFYIAFSSANWNELEQLREYVSGTQSRWYDGMNVVGRRRPPPMRGRPGSRPQCEQMLQAVRDAVTNDEKKKSLEGLIRFLVDRVDYLRVKYTDLRTTSSEIDLIVENRGRSRHTMFDEFGRHFLVECKNWSGRVGAKEVRDFVGKLLKTKIRLGLLVTREGVTGSDGGEDALREIHFCFDALNTAVLVLTEEDLEALCAGADLHTLLDQRFDRLRFDLP